MGTTTTTGGPADEQTLVLERFRRLVAGLDDYSVHYDRNGPRQHPIRWRGYFFGLGRKGFERLVRPGPIEVMRAVPDPMLSYDPSLGGAIRLDAWHRRDLIELAIRDLLPRHKRMRMAPVTVWGDRVVWEGYHWDVFDYLQLVASWPGDLVPQFHDVSTRAELMNLIWPK